MPSRTAPSASIIAGRRRQAAAFAGTIAGLIFKRFLREEFGR